MNITFFVARSTARSCCRPRFVESSDNVDGEVQRNTKLSLSPDWLQKPTCIDGDRLKRSPGLALPSQKLPARYNYREQRYRGTKPPRWGSWTSRIRGRRRKQVLASGYDEHTSRRSSEVWCFVSEPISTNTSSKKDKIVWMRYDKINAYRVFMIFEKKLFVFIQIQTLPL